MLESYLRIQSVQTKEPDERGECIDEHAHKPCPIGPYDGQTLFHQRCPVADTLAISRLSLLERKSREKRKRVDKSYDSGSGER